MHAIRTGLATRMYPTRTRARLCLGGSVAHRKPLLRLLYALFSLSNRPLFALDRSVVSSVTLNRRL